MKTWESGGIRVCARLPEGETEPYAVWAHLSPEEAEAVKPTACALLAVSGADWNRDFSPWPAKAAFRGGEDFSGGADMYLRALTQDWIPGAESAFGLRPAKRLIAGYSLAGLFALYALAQTDCFDGAASVSGSLWYDGFAAYLASKRERFAGKAIYLSLGDAEARARNARLAVVWDRTREAETLFRESGARVAFESNPGGHFSDPAGRMAKGVCGLIKLLEDV